jgi:hypothetical protein
MQLKGVTNDAANKWHSGGTSVRNHLEFVPLPPKLAPSPLP